MSKKIGNITALVVIAWVSSLIYVLERYKLIISNDDFNTAEKWGSTDIKECWTYILIIEMKLDLLDNYILELVTLVKHS